MTMLRIMRVAPIIAALAGCGGGSGSPTAPSPSPPVQIAGTWDGVLDSTNFPQQAITLTLAQSGTGITGTWVSGALGWAGAVTGTVSTNTFSGAFTINTPAATGGTCTGTAAVSGGVSSTAVAWTSPGFTGPCGGMPSGVRITTQRK